MARRPLSEQAKKTKAMAKKYRSENPKPANYIPKTVSPQVTSSVVMKRKTGKTGTSWAGFQKSGR